MLARLRNIRFETYSLGVLGLSVAVMYALALGDVRAPTSDAGRGIVRAMPVSMSGFEGVQTARWVIDRAASVQALESLFERIEYRLDGVRDGDLTVPRVIVQEVPADLAKVESADERKRLFIKFTLPLILHVNERIRAQRARLLELREAYGRVGAVDDPDERAWLERLAARYAVDEPNFADLVRRVDIIPPSLALAQGAEESGWGTSRFVREGNAIFGQRTFVEGQGLVPRRRDDDKNHEVKRFGQLVESVSAYVMNLNTHPAYRNFRLERAQQRRTRERLDSHALAGALKRYSERGVAYVRTIRTIIRANKLTAFDGARLGEVEAAIVSESRI